jgi:hypothetical protein
MRAPGGEEGSAAAAAAAAAAFYDVWLCMRVCRCCLHSLRCVLLVRPRDKQIRGNQALWQQTQQEETALVSIVYLIMPEANFDRLMLQLSFFIFAFRLFAPHDRDRRSASFTSPL